MSLYNLLHGVNPISLILLAILGIDQPNGKWQSGRFRDIYLSEDGTKIILYTRNGGGNRECCSDTENTCDINKPETLCAGCVIEKHLPNHPNYLKDYDDDFDCTYAYVEFSIPEQSKELVKRLITGEKPKTISEKFKDTMTAMENMRKEDIEKDERFKPIIEILEKISDPENKETELTL